MKLDKILVLSGDGIGPAVTRSAEMVLNASVGSLEILHGDVGLGAYESTGSYLPHDTLDLIDECRIILSGPAAVPANVKNPLATLKIQLDLYARGRFYKTLAPDLGVKDMDVTLWSSYNNIASEISEVSDFDGITISKYIKDKAYNRMMTAALSDVEARGLKSVVCLSREDFFPISSGMFNEAFDQAFGSRPLETRHMNVKDWMSEIFKYPRRDDCIVCVDLYNQIVAGALSGLAGNENLYPTVYKGTDYSLYEPNFAPEIEGFEEGFVNPTSAIIAAAEILANMDLKTEARRIIDSLCETYKAGERTPDVGGKLSTKEFTDRVLSRL